MKRILIVLAFPASAEYNNNNKKDNIEHRIQTTPIGDTTRSKATS